LSGTRQIACTAPRIHTHSPNLSGGKKIKRKRNRKRKKKDTEKIEKTEKYKEINLKSIDEAALGGCDLGGLSLSSRFIVSLCYSSSGSVSELRFC
jgi:hypothetical protein